VSNFWGSHHNRYDIEVITEQKSMHIWAEFTGCNFKLGTDGDMEPLIAKGREWTLNECRCKIEDGTTYYRKITSNSGEGVSSGSYEDESSSSVAVKSSDAKDDKSSSSNKGMSSASSSSSSAETSSDESSSSKDTIIPAGSLVKKCDGCNAFKDKRDDNIYRVTQIGDQIWMAEDLRYKNPNFTNGIACSNRDNDCRNYGYLYTFAAAMDNAKCAAGNLCKNAIEYPHRGSCPEGFHVPEHSEWEKLDDYVSENIDDSYYTNDALIAQYGWSQPGDDAFGFTALPTGEFDGYNIFYDQYARYWASTEDNANGAYEWYMGKNSRLQYQTYKKSYGYAVRCVADGKIELTEKKDGTVFSSSSSSKQNSSSSHSSSSSVDFSSSDTPYSSSVDFKLIKAEGCDDCNAFEDVRDNSVYRAKWIGGNIWMTEDLRYGGTEENPLESANCPDGECTERGRLYSYDAAMDACPEGWTLPSKWQLQDLLSKHPEDFCEEGDAWDNDGTNMTGFSAVPTGEWSPGSGYAADLRYARYWSSTEVDDKGAYMIYFSPGFYSGQTFSKSYGYAVRCIATADVVLTETKVIE